MNPIVLSVCYFSSMTQATQPSSASASASAPAAKYQRCMVLAGGGFRFGIYLGMHAALRDTQRAPDLLLASCGGAIAATLIAALPDDAQRKEWLCSRQMYEYWREVKSTRKAAITRALAQAFKRKLARANAASIPDLFHDYLFDVPDHLPLPAAPAQHVAVAVVGGKLLYGPDEVGQARRQRKLFTQTVFCPPRAAALLHGMPSPMSAPLWGDNAIAAPMHTDVTMPLAVAARISIADMYYIRCYHHDGHDYIGGVLDLFPIELARQLADKVVMEFKESFDQTFSIPAWRAVLGVDGNERLRYANAQEVDVRIDTSDVTQALERQALRKRLDWRRNRIELELPPDYATYVRFMEDQWQYGYQRTMEACNRRVQRGDQSMRQMDRYNVARR
ncbi:MAG: patatin-like phospholipase family protein [Pseudomonadota bacterium]